MPNVNSSIAVCKQTCTKNLYLCLYLSLSTKICTCVLQNVPEPAENRFSRLQNKQPPLWPKNVYVSNRPLMLDQILQFFMQKIMLTRNASPLAI